MSQVCFTTYFPEWGKGSREGYSIYYYARASARAPGPYEKEPERWKFLPDGTKNILEGWYSLSDDTKKIRKYSPRNGKNVRSGGKFIPENVDFSYEKPREKYENDENGEKNFFPCTGKNMKIIPMARKKCLKLGNGKRKKRIFLLKKFRRSIKNIETDRKFSQLHIKKAGKIIPTKRKRSQKTDDPDEKKAADFFADGRKNAEKDARQDRKICRSIRKNMKISRRKEKRCISGRMVHSEKKWIFYQKNTEKRQTDGKETRES